MKAFLQKKLTAVVLCCLSIIAFTQRTYKPHSVLATGNWYKIEVAAEGIYKIDVSFLNSIGISGNIPTAQVRVFGNGGSMLPENNTTRIEDLEENAIMVVDGNDGVLNGSDYILFFSKGPHQWIADTANKRFTHKKNLYSDKAYYFITTGGSGKRIISQTFSPLPATSVTSFNERYFYELDSVNFLASGKEWFGDEFGITPGRVTSRTFTIPAAGIVQNGAATIISSVAARSVNVSSQFNVLVNNQLQQQISVPAIGAGYLDLFAHQAQQANNLILLQNNISLTYNYTGGSLNAQGWLNWFEVFYRRSLTLVSDQQLLFRDWSSVGSNSAEFIISGANTISQVWDVSNPLVPARMNSILNGSQLRFSNDAQSLHEYVCFSGAFLIPQFVGRVANQNLHNTVEKDYIIITHPSFLLQAQQLADFHQKQNNLQSLIVTTEQVFNEFACGIPDPAAIRDFVKMYYDKYRSSWSNSPKYLLLFGRASFDYKDRIKNNTNLVPAYESFNSTDPLSSYTSDDFFGFLDDEEDINSGLLINKLDIAIGRIPAKNVDEAKNIINKIEEYHAPASFGPWRNNLNFIADDEDYNLHLQDAEVITNTTTSTAPIFNIYKIYLDAFRQEGGSAGGRYPQANAVINNNIYNGTLIWNYSGHGGPPRLAEEVVIDHQIVNSWNNQNRLPLFITATCDFAPYDNPTVNSLGENLLLRAKTGAVALMTTTRVVFAFSNRIINNNYLQIALQPDSSGKYKSLGESIQATKNYTYQTSGDVINNRKFALLGDPAMTLAFPGLKIKTTLVNGKNIQAQADTLSATEFVTLQGEITDNSGSRITEFKGTVYLSLFDKPQTITTLGNDATSLPVQFMSQTNTLFKGKVSANAGAFSFTFKMPKDINYQFGNGKISLYAQDGKKDANGFSTNVSIGGIDVGGSTDNIGPEIKAYLNDERFVNGSMTNQHPVLIVKLSDSSGINTGSGGIDHDIVATLDGDNRQYFVLNDFYESDLDSYQQGAVRFQLPELSPGHHTIKVKAWDVLNNSSEYILEFTVANNDKLTIGRVLNYPNPFTTTTTFWFEHNKPAADLQVKVEIFTVTGKLVKTLRQTINNKGNRSSDVVWDGRDEYGDKVGRGIYLYRLGVHGADGKKAEKLERLVIIR
ncbi:MAG: type IX secretion system sortase PorU [Chitinophagaceae bacterium]